MAEKRLSHAYMLTGPDGPARRRAVTELCAALLCPEADPPCGQCRDCRKVRAGIHPDVITVRRQPDEKGRMRQKIVVDQARDMVADAYVAPNEARRKVYVIEEAETMNTEAQNALLKALEEPPGHACFVLCAAAPDALLTTVRSRCVRLDETDRNAQTAPLSDLARAYIDLLAGDDPAAMTRFCLMRAKLTREEADALLEEIAAALTDILCARRKGPALTAARVLAAQAHLARGRELLARNIGVKQVFGLLCAQFDLGVTNDRDKRNS